MVKSSPPTTLPGQPSNVVGGEVFTQETLFLNAMKRSDIPASTNICITFIQRQPNIFDLRPALHECYTNVLCLLGSLLNGYSVKIMLYKSPSPILYCIRLLGENISGQGYCVSQNTKLYIICYVSVELVVQRLTFTTQETKDVESMLV